MPGKDRTGFTPFLESIENLDEKRSISEIEAMFSEGEEREKLLAEDRESLLNDIQNRLRQELERAGLVPKGENDD